MHRELRITTAFPVEITWQGEVVTAEAEDLSLRGVFVRTSEPFAPGAVVHATLALPAGPRITVVARVAHRLTPSSARALGRKPGMGLEFLEHEGEGRERLNDYLEPRLAHPAPQRARAKTLPQVLVVDDDPAELARVADVLRNAGFGVRSAGSGAIAYASALESQPDVMLIAADMAGMDGWSLVETLMGRSVLHSVPIVLMLEESEDLGRLGAQYVGVADFIRRPFDDDELSVRLHRVVSGGRATAGRVVLRGSVEEIGLRTLLSLMDFERKSGVLEVRGADQRVRLFVAGGRVVKLEGPEGDARAPVTRLMDVLHWERGEFELSVCEVVGEDEISMKTSVLLLEAARVGDERSGF